MTTQSDSRAGAFVVLVGPDGVGKTTVASAIARLVDGECGYFHFRPTFNSRLSPHPTTGGACPKVSRKGFGPIGWARIMLGVARFWIAYVTTIWPACRKGMLVIGDRWAYGYAAQPLALKYYGPAWLASACLRIIPAPHIVANLVAPPDVIQRRKAELTRPQIKRELEAWKRLPVNRIRFYDATLHPDAIAKAILRDLNLFNDSSVAHVSANGAGGPGPTHGRSVP